MCECGCSINTKKYRLRGPTRGAFYVVEIYQGCRNCSAPPGVTIYRVGNGYLPRDEVEEMPYLPFIVRDKNGECPIKCGMDPDAFTKAFCAQVTFGGFAGISVRDSAQDLAEMVWDEAVKGTVEVIEPRKSDAKAKGI